MKHQSARRRNGRRHADPSVICLPNQMPPYTPPRKEPEAISAPLIVRDDAALDAELLAQRNIFEIQPRMSRQARRKAMRAERKAARRTATERFLAGAPSLGEAAQIVSIPALSEAEAACPDTDEENMETGEALVAQRVCVETLEEAGAAPTQTSGSETVPHDTVARMISATGPLIVSSFDDAPVDVGGQAGADPGSAPLPVPNQAEETIAAESESSEPAAPPPVEPERSATPLPRNRALVRSGRRWMMRLVPWHGARNVPAPEPARVQLQDLRFELAMTLRRLDRIIDTLPETAR